MTPQEIAILLGAVAAIITAVGGYRLGASEKARQEAGVNESIVKATKELLDPLSARVAVQQTEMDSMRVEFNKCKSRLLEVIAEQKRQARIVTQLRKQLKDAGIEPIE